MYESQLKYKTAVMIIHFKFFSKYADISDAQLFEKQQLLSQ